MRLRNTQEARTALATYNKLTASCAALKGKLLVQAMHQRMPKLLQLWKRCGKQCYIQCATGSRSDIPQSPYIIRRGIRPQVYKILGSLADVAQEIDRIKAKVL